MGASSADGGINCSRCISSKLCISGAADASAVACSGCISCMHSGVAVVWLSRSSIPFCAAAAEQIVIPRCQPVELLPRELGIINSQVQVTA